MSLVDFSRVQVTDRADVYNMLVRMLDPGDGQCHQSWHILQGLLETGVSVAKDPQYEKHPKETTNDQK